MESGRTIWELREGRCSHCYGTGALYFSTCPACGHVVLICDEVGHVYPRPHDIAQVADRLFNDRLCLCPNCGKVSLPEFRDSTLDEIERSGFPKHQCALVS